MIEVTHLQVVGKLISHFSDAVKVIPHKRAVYVKRKSNIYLSRKVRQRLRDFRICLIDLFCPTL